jgi:hypothetical protein
MGYAYLAVPVSGLFIMAFSVQRLGDILAAPLQQRSGGGRQSATPQSDQLNDD